ncbi:MAG: helix-turn-helix transcriptional regulator [Raoultibacter sp.]
MTESGENILECLTGREAAIVSLFSRGRNLRYACRQLCISYNTGKTHVRHIYLKLGVSSRQELLDLIEE